MTVWAGTAARLAAGTWDGVRLPPPPTKKLKSKGYDLRLFKGILGRSGRELAEAGGGRIRIDIVKFDEWLHSQAVDYEERGLSMAEAVTERFGAEAMEFLDKLL